jgi:hypothetical protein
MAYDVEPNVLTDILGHDGSHLVSHTYPEPRGRVGFHVQEMIHCGILLGYKVTPYELAPVSLIEGLEVPLPEVYRRFALARDMYEVQKGVITGKARYCAHAIAFDSGHAYDPDKLGPEQIDLFNLPVFNFFPQTLWLVNK